MCVYIWPYVRSTNGQKQNQCNALGFGSELRIEMKRNVGTSYSRVCVRACVDDCLFSVQCLYSVACGRGADCEDRDPLEIPQGSRGDGEGERLRNLAGFRL